MYIPASGENSGIIMSFDQFGSILFSPLDIDLNSYFILFQVILVLTYNNGTKPTNTNIYRFDSFSVSESGH